MTPETTRPILERMDENQHETSSRPDIRPGEGVADFPLGLPRQVVTTRLGQPDRIFLGDKTYSPEQAPMGAYHVYFEPKLRFRFDEDGVVEIGVLDPAFRLANSLGVNSPGDQVLQTLGMPESRRQYALKESYSFSRLGLEVVLDQQGRVVCMVVFRPREATDRADDSAASSKPNAPGNRARRPPYRCFVQNRFSRGSPPEAGDDIEVICYEENTHFRELTDLLNSLVFEDHGHGLAHAHRVASWCMAFYTQLEPDGKDALDFYLMGFLHDLGRTSGEKDPAPGERSVETIHALGLDLPVGHLEAIRTHTQKHQADTLAEQCLFDADRLDSCRFNMAPNRSRLSPSLIATIDEHTLLARLFFQNRHCCLVPPNIHHRHAVKWLIYLHRHLDFLRPERLYYGSLSAGLELLQSPLGKGLVASPDPGEALHTMLKGRDQHQPEISIYELAPTNVREIEVKRLGIEFLLDEKQRPRREYRYRCAPDLGPIEQYQRFRLPETWRSVGPKPDQSMRSKIE